MMATTASDSATKAKRHSPSSFNKEKLPGKMTSDELKTKLYQRFQQQGVLDELRAHLRERLVKELYSMCRKPHTLPMSKHEESTNSAINNEITLPLQVANWMVQHHLHQMNYVYTLSTFMTEGAMSVSGLQSLTVHDILILLGIFPDSSVHKKLTSNIKSSSLFYNIIQEVLNDITSKQTKQTSQTQTERILLTPDSLQDPHELPVENRLQSIDDMLYERKRKTFERKSLEEELKSVEKRVSNQSRSEMKSMFEDFQQEFNNKMKTRNSNFVNDLSIIEKELESSYQRKFDEMIDKENQIREEAKRQQNIVQEETHHLRELLSKELNALRRRETKMIEELENKRKQLVMEEEELKQKKEDHLLREEKLFKKEVHLDKFIETKLKEFQEKERFKMKQKFEELNQLEKKLSVRNQNLEEEKLHLEEMKNEQETKDRKLRELQLIIKSLDSEKTALVKQNEALLNRLEILSDHSVLKTDLRSTTKELASTRTYLEDLQKELESEKAQAAETIRELKYKLNKPSTEVSKLQKELERIKDSHKLDEGMWQERRHRLERELEDTQRLAQSITVRNEQLLKQIQDMNLVIRDLREQVREAQVHADAKSFITAQCTETQTQLPTSSRLATDIEMPIHNKTSSVGRASTTFHPLGSFFDTSLSNTHLPPELQLVPPTYPFMNQSYIKNESAKFLSEAKHRIKRLQQESEVLDSRYNHYLQNRSLDSYSYLLKNASSSYRIPPDKAFLTNVTSEEVILEKKGEHDMQHVTLPDKVSSSILNKTKNFFNPISKYIPKDDDASPTVSTPVKASKGKRLSNNSLDLLNMQQKFDTVMGETSECKQPIGPQDCFKDLKSLLEHDSSVSKDKNPDSSSQDTDEEKRLGQATSKDLENEVRHGFVESVIKQNTEWKTQLPLTSNSSEINEPPEFKKIPVNLNAAWENQMSNSCKDSELTKTPVNLDSAWKSKRSTSSKLLPIEEPVNLGTEWKTQRSVPSKILQSEQHLESTEAPINLDKEWKTQTSTTSKVLQSEELLESTKAPINLDKEWKTQTSTTSKVLQSEKLLESTEAPINLDKEWKTQTSTTSKVLQSEKLLESTEAPINLDKEWKTQTSTLSNVLPSKEPSNNSKSIVNLDAVWKAQVPILKSSESEIGSYLTKPVNNLDTSLENKKSTTTKITKTLPKSQSVLLEGDDKNIVTLTDKNEVPHEEIDLVKETGTNKAEPDTVLLNKHRNLPDPVLNSNKSLESSLNTPFSPIHTSHVSEPVSIVTKKKYFSEDGFIQHPTATHF
ncbi:oral-facial-digital syndrome 1 protein-like isoform X1 [Limulus polyphemus]|uniref:Oral-facial-digital syndrome 1 protein-like isoform X1 n=1 Tax=Limulus polyphemus TaxID=6850 RepID=A0ABM1TLY1_LIMPO|nr:oral-facial-digital syndrome 1 protein-like isoform X1 [Limulus polyphemus]